MVVTAALALAVTADAESLSPTRADVESINLVTDIFKQLIEMNTTDSVGSTTVAAEAMAKRLRDAGFPAEDVVVLGPNPRRAT
jgi:Flp pilus assembly protein TadD